jgi:hypothetical protein
LELQDPLSGGHGTGGGFSFFPNLPRGLIRHCHNYFVRQRFHFAGEAFVILPTGEEFP